MKDIATMHDDVKKLFKDEVRDLKAELEQERDA